MTQTEMIPYIKDAIKDLEKRNENDFHQVMMYFSAVYSNYYLLIADKFHSQEDYNFFKEYLNRSHDFLLEAVDKVRQKDPSYSTNNFLPIRIILSGMLFSIEKREKNLV